MIRPSPESYSFVQIERPLENADAFLSQVRSIGEQALGSQVVSSVSGVEVSGGETGDEFIRLSHLVIPTRAPVMHVAQANEIGMLLLHRSAPPSEASKYSFGYLQNRLAAGASTTHRSDYDEAGNRTSNRYKTHLPPLAKEFDDISSSFGVDPDELRVTCDRIDVVGEPGGDIVLGLSPAVTDWTAGVLREQSRAAYHRLAVISSRTASPLSPWQVTAPFARIPGGINKAQYQFIMGSITALLRERGISVSLGGADFSSKDRGTVR